MREILFKSSQRVLSIVKVWEKLLKPFLEKIWKLFSVYSTTAANEQESSYACYYDPEIETYLGDLYSVNWMEDTEKVPTNFYLIVVFFLHFFHILARHSPRNVNRTIYHCQNGNKRKSRDGIRRFEYRQVACGWLPGGRTGPKNSLSKCWFLVKLA